MAMKGSPPVALLQKLFRDRDSMETAHENLRQNQMDSNNVERPIALNRNNALFAGHDEGGKTWARRPDTAYAALLIPWVRHSSETGTPFSSSFKIATIWASE
jgi:hypothetical protein